MSRQVYHYEIGAWNGGNYEGYAWGETIAADLDEVEVRAGAELQAAASGGEDCDLRIAVTDGDGDEVYAKTYQYSQAQAAQEAMDATWDDEGEFSTDRLGVRGAKWYTWSNNGGTRGAHDRMTSSGRWIEHYEMPQAVEPEAALDWLIERGGLSVEEAVEAMADASPEHSAGDIVRRVGRRVWRHRTSDYTGLYRVHGALYAVDCNDARVVDDDDALEFAVAENDGDEDEVRDAIGEETR